MVLLDLGGRNCATPNKPSHVDITLEVDDECDTRDWRSKSHDGWVYCWEPYCPRLRSRRPRPTPSQHTFWANITVDKKLLGPAYKDVGMKYAGDSAAPAKLEQKVKNGGSGV